MSFEQEVLLARIRPRGGRLALPTLLLCIAAFFSTFLASKLDQQWQIIALNSVCGAIVIFGFLLPLLRYLTSWTDITSSSIVSRSGLVGQRHRSVSLQSIQGIEVTGSSTLNLLLLAEPPLELAGLPKAKFVAAEIEKLKSNSQSYLQGAK